MIRYPLKKHLLTHKITFCPYYPTIRNIFFHLMINTAWLTYFLFLASLAWCLAILETVLLFTWSFLTKTMHRRGNHFFHYFKNTVVTLDYDLLLLYIYSLSIILIVVEYKIEWVAAARNCVISDDIVSSHH